MTERGMTKRELIDALEAHAAPDEARVFACIVDATPVVEVDQQILHDDNGSPWIMLG